MTARAIPLRRLWTYSLMVLAVVVLASGILAGRAYLALPDLGFSFGRGDVVGQVKPGSGAYEAGLQIGDRVLAISGSSPFAGEMYARPGQESVILTISRPGRIVHLELVPDPLAATAVLNRLSYLITALTFWAIAAVLLAYKPHGEQAKLLALQLLLAAFTMPILLLADYGLGWASLLTNTMVLFLGLLIVYYHTIFPERVEFRGKRLLLVALACIGGLLLVAFGWVRLGHHGEWSTPVVTAVRAFFATCLLLGMSLLARSYWRTASDKGRRQIRVVVLGTGLALLPLIAFILVPQMVPGVPYVVIEPAFLALTLIPAAYLYAIRRQELMRLDGVVSQTAAHSLLFLILFLLYVAISWVTGRLASRAPSDWADSGAMAILQHGAVIGGLMASFQPLKTRIERLVHRLLYGSWYDYQSFISRLTEGLGDAVDMDEILELLLRELAGTMRVKAVALLVPDPRRKDAFAVQAQAGFDSLSGHRLSQGLGQFLVRSADPVEQVVLSNQVAPGTEAHTAVAAWGQAGARLWIPLAEQGRVEGVLVLGAKQADEFLTQTDQDILRTLRRHTASALARVRMVRELEGRLREKQALSRQLLATQGRDRKRIASDIHHHAVQEIIGVRMGLQNAIKDLDWEAIAEAWKDLGKVIDSLRSIIADFRPTAIVSHDLRQMMRHHAGAFQRKRKLPVVVHMAGNGTKVPDDVREAIFWIFAESLTNAWKHAQASRIEARLDVQHDRLCLDVSDDGQGFEVPPYLDELLSDGHLGLMEMREYVGLVGGHFTLVSEPGQGTHIVVEVPLDPARAGDRS